MILKKNTALFFITLFMFLLSPLSNIILIDDNELDSIILFNKKEKESVKLVMEVASMDIDFFILDNVIVSTNSKTNKVYSKSYLNLISQPPDSFCNFLEYK